MKSLSPILLLIALHASAGATTYVNFVRQIQQQGSGTVWDMPVAPVGAAPSALNLQTGGALFQLWTVEQPSAQNYLLDQKLVATYLPSASVTVTTLDSYKRAPRTRVDKPFTVQINVTGIVTTATNGSKEQTRVMLQRYLANYPSGNLPLDPVAVTAGTPYTSAYISNNGNTVLTFPATALTAADPTKAAGEEYFVVKIPPDSSFPVTQIASGFVQVWPVASGSIKGISQNGKVRFQMPDLELALNNLYPLSSTYLVLYKGTAVNPSQGTVVTSYPMESDVSESHVIQVPGNAFSFPEDGTYTIALISDTVYGRELLTSPVTFTVNTALQVNAMQVEFARD